MSLLTTNLKTVTIKRQTTAKTVTKGNARTFSTAARGSLPTSASGRLMKASPREREQYGIRDEDATDYMLFTSNPRVDNRDQFIVAATATTPERTLNVLTLTNVQELDRLWIASLEESNRGVK
jgi:hypothetical protein